MSLDFAAIHAAVGDWRAFFLARGYDETLLVGRNKPCPACGGRDRFTFDNRTGRGDFYCRGCGPGDAFDLMARTEKLTLSEARREVILQLGLDSRRLGPELARRRSTRPPPVEPARPAARVKLLLRTASRPGEVQDVVDYLASRSLWPLPDGCRLRAHAAAEYWHRGDDDCRPICIGRFPALLAEVRDIDDELVTLHATYLEHGRKLEREGLPARKLLGKMAGRRGCSVHLMPVAGDELGICEGLESGLAAGILHDGLPVWSALNAGLLAKWEPPPAIRRVRIFADADRAGFTAANTLRERLDGCCDAFIDLPPKPFNDFADVLAAKAST